jgi:hypothetical protein
MNDAAKRASVLRRQPCSCSCRSLAVADHLQSAPLRAVGHAAGWAVLSGCQLSALIERRAMNLPESPRQQTERTNQPSSESRLRWARQICGSIPFKSIPSLRKSRSTTKQSNLFTSSPTTFLRPFLMDRESRLPA